MAARRKNSGDIAAEEETQRQEQVAASKEKAVKSATENATAPPASEENRQDVLVVAGADLRDGAEVDEKADAFVFDADAKTASVDHISVASNAQELRIEIDGKYFTFNVQQAVALNRLVAAGTVALNY